LRPKRAVIQIQAMRKFQSHAGSIEAQMWPPVRRMLSGFNPTLVRLRRTCRRARPPILPPFQSHAGSIEAATRSGSGVHLIRCFNPTLVRLRQAPSEAGDGRPPPVSIPRWFD
jgi:hypothetical protein